MSAKPATIQACNTQPCLTNMIIKYGVNDFLTIRIYNGLGGPLVWSAAFSWNCDNEYNCRDNWVTVNASVPARSTLVVYADYQARTELNFVRLILNGSLVLSGDNYDDWFSATYGPYYVNT